MNKIYKVIWNKVRNCYVVVSEITKARSKGGSTVRRVPRMEAVLTAMLLASVLSLGISAPVWAESSTGAKYYGVNYSAGETGNLNGEGASGTHSIAAGVNAKATGENAISIGFSANSSEITGDSALWLPTVITNRMIRKFEDDGTPSLDDEGNPVYWSADNWQKWNDTTNGITKQNALTAEMNYRWKKESGGTDGSIAIGDSTFSLKGDVVIGSRALALGNDAVAVGREAIGYDNSVALGALASAAPNSIAIGGSITESKDNTTTTYTTKAAANYSIAIGSKAEALQSNAMALGIGASAAGGQSTAVGYNASASGSNSTAAGMNAKAAGSNSTAVGFNARANGGNAVSIGNGLANTGKSIAIGDTNTEAKGNQSISIGASTKSFKENSLAMGVGAKAYGKESTTVGFHAYSFGENSTVFGHDSTSHGEASAVFGYLSTAGAVTLIKGDKEQKSTDAWSRTQVVRADKGSGGTITYVRLGKQSVSPNQYELVTTVSGQIVALKRDTAEKTGNNDIPEYHEVIELRKADAKDGNTTVPGYWFVVDTVNKLDVKKINIDDKYHIRKKVSEGVYIDYGSQTEGGVAFGDFTNAVGNKTLAVGRSTVADGNNSAAVGMFANAYGTGGMAYGQNTSTGLVNKIAENSGQYTTNLKKPHAGSETINSESVAGYRRLVNGNSAMLNKLNESVLIDFRNSKGETVEASPVKLNAMGEISAYWTGGTAQTDEDYLNPDNWSSVTKVDSIKYKGNDVMLDTDSNRYYYNDGEEKHYINDTEDLTFTFTYNNGSGTVTAQAGNFLLSQGGMAVGAYAHAEGDKAMAIGRVAGAFGNSSAAVGRYANAFGEGAVVLGHNAVAGAQVTDDGDGKKILKLSADGTGIPVTIKKEDTTEFVKGGVAIGSYAHALGDQAVSIGLNAGAFGHNSSVMGPNSEANGKNAVAIGSDSVVAGDDSIAIGTGHTVSGSNSGAFGDPTTIRGNNSYSVGNNNTIDKDLETDKTVTDVFAVGNSITTVTSNSAFLGDNAAYVQADATLEDGTTGGLKTVEKATVNSFEFGNFAGATPVGVVSVGAGDSERRIQNVAAGLIAEGSTDAINGSQLYTAIDTMQFDIVGGDNVEVTKTKDTDGHTVYTIQSWNAAVKPGPSGNVTVDPQPGEGNGTGGQTPEAGIGETAAAAPAPNDHTTVYTVDAKDTTYTIKTEAGTGKVVNKYTITGSDKTTMEIEDTDTRYELSDDGGKDAGKGKTTYTISLKDKQGVIAGEAKVVDTNTTYKGVQTVKAGSVPGKGSTTFEITDNSDDAVVGSMTIKAGENITITKDGDMAVINAKASSNVKVIEGEHTTVTPGKDGDFTTYAVNVVTDGKVASGDSGIVTGETVYKETRVAKDGNYIRKDYTAAENITALDDKVKDNATNIENLNNQVNNTYNQISHLDDRMKKGLAGAAALAALHPMDFDTDSKLTFAAGVGNYRGANAGAVGAFYRPDEKIMFSLGGTFGNDENMINAGVSFALDRVNRVTTSRTAMAKEIVELRDHIARQDEQIAKQDEQIAKLTELVNKLAGAEQQQPGEASGKAAAK